MRVSTYRYKGKVIVEKQIKFNNYSGIDIWHYMSDFHPERQELPVDFAIFDGYENYGLYPTLSVGEVVKRMQTTRNYYTTKNKVKMVYMYQLAPKSIGSVELVTYTQRYPIYHESLSGMSTLRPTIIKIWYSKISSFPDDPTDQEIINAKRELAKLAEMIDLQVYK